MRAVHAARILMRRTLLVGLVLMQVRKKMTVRARTQLRVRLWVTE